MKRGFGSKFNLHSKTVLSASTLSFSKFPECIEQSTRIAWIAEKMRGGHYGFAILERQQDGCIFALAPYHNRIAIAADPLDRLCKVFLRFGTTQGV